jgi:hypothetical protein
VTANQSQYFETDWSLAQRDFTGDGQVDAADYTIWADSYLQSPAAATLPIDRSVAAPVAALTAAVQQRSVDAVFGDERRWDTAGLRGIYFANHDVHGTHANSADALFDRLGESDDEHPRFSHRKRSFRRL